MKRRLNSKKQSKNKRKNNKQNESKFTDVMCICVWQCKEWVYKRIVKLYNICDYIDIDGEGNSAADLKLPEAGNPNHNLNNIETEIYLQHANLFPKIC